MAIQSGYGGLGGEKSRPTNSATTRVTSKEILARVKQQQQEPAISTTQTTVDSTPATEEGKLAFVRYKKLGPAGVAMWLEPAINALGGVVVADSDSETSGAISVPEAQEEAARAAIIEWCELDEEI